MTDFSEFSDDDLRRINKLIEIRNTRVRFAKTHHRNTKGEHLEFESFAHMRELYNTLSMKIAIMGGAQIGKTDWLVIDSLAHAYCGLNGFFVLPKFDMRDNFVQEKVQRPLALSPEYRKITQESTFSRIQQMQFGAGLIKFVGGNVASDFVSYSADLYVVDEIDKCDSDENIELGFSRMDASLYKFERFASNPTTKAGWIYKRYQLSDKRVWMCPCDKCYQKSELDFFASVVEEIADETGNVITYQLRDKEWRRGCGRDIRMICPKCGSGTLQRNHHDREWVATAVSERNITGYHMPSLIAPRNTVTEIYHEFLDGLENPSKMSRFYSMRLALPYAAQSNRVSENLLVNCSDKDFNFEIHPDYACIPADKHDGPCSMGIDVNSNHFDIRISAYEKGKRRAVYLGKISRDSEYMIHDLIDRYKVGCMVIDIGPETHVSRQIVSDAKCDAWMCKYRGSGADREAKLNYVDTIVTVDRTEYLDKTYSQLKTKKNILPKNFDSVFGGTYSSEMCDMSREVVEDTKGNLKYQWNGTGKDHHRHADLYDMIAFELMSEDVLIPEDCIFVG